MENMGIKKVTEELRKLNPNTDIRTEESTYPAIIIVSCSDCAQLKLPDGYEFNEKNGLTNKHNTTYGLYENFDLMTMYEYLAQLA